MYKQSVSLKSTVEDKMLVCKELLAIVKHHNWWMVDGKDWGSYL